MLELLNAQSFTTIQRNWNDIFKQNNDVYNDISWQNQPQFSFNQINMGGQTDTRISPSRFEQIFFSDPISSGIYGKIADLLTLSDFEVYEVKRDGSLSLTRPAKEYKQLLVKNKLRERLEHGFASAFWGTGLGNALTYRLKSNGRLEFRTEPFIVNGMERIRVYGDQNGENLESKEYGVLDETGIEIYRFKAKDVIHHRYVAPNGSYYFSASPGLVASKWLNLKYNLLAAIDANASGGLLAKYLVGVDQTKLKNMGITSADAIANATNSLKEQLRQGKGIQNAGGMIFTEFPLLFQNIQMSNSEQRVTEMLPLINNEIFYAYGVDPAILDKRNSKYDTADQARDDLYQSCQATFKKIERDIEKGELKWIDPDFNNSRFIFRIPRQFSQEEIRIKEINDKAISIFFNNLKTANETFSGQGVVVVPTEDKLKSLEEQGMYFKTPAKEEVNIQPSSETQLADTFTKISQSDNVIRQNLQLDYWQEVKSKLDKSFKAVLNG